MAPEIFIKYKKGNFFTDVYGVKNGNSAGEYFLKQLPPIIKNLNESPSIDEHSQLALKVLECFDKRRKVIWSSSNRETIKMKKLKVTHLQMDLGTYSL